MSFRTRAASWLRTAVFARRQEREMDEEWRFHLDSRVDELRAGGLDTVEAERVARAEFGDPRRWKEEGRHARGFRLIDELRFDVRFSVRQARRTPGLAFAIVATIALGVGTNAALFSVVNAVLVRPLPYPSPERLVRLWEVNPHGDDRNVVSRGNYLDWREQATSFEEIGAHSGTYGMALTGIGEPVRIDAARITTSTFHLLGARPLLGRTFETREYPAAEGSEAGEVVLSFGFWQEKFAGDVNVIGRVLRIDDKPYSIVGVVPKSFVLSTPGPQVWVPATFTSEDRNERRSHNWHVIGRLKPGVSVEAAGIEMNSIAARTATLYPEAMAGWGVNVVQLHRDLVGDVRPLLVILVCLSLAALTAACANLASLLLARARHRESEFAVRAAIGANLGRIVRQVVTEVLVLGVVGGALGIGLVTITLPSLLAAVPRNIPLLERVSVDPVVTGFAFVLTLVTSLAVGMVPALRLTRADLTASLHGTRGTAGVQAGRTRAGLLVSQFALSALLLVAAALLVQSFRRLAAVDCGFDSSRLAEGMLDLPRVRYPDQLSQERFYAALLERVRALPGVESAGLATDPPLSGNTMTFSFAIEGKPAASPSGREDPVSLLAVSAGYFETLKLPLLAGRTLRESDRRGSPPVVVINNRLARRFWPEATAIGSRISFIGTGGPWYEIVGVVGDIRGDGLDQPAVPAIYLTFEQRQSNWGWLSWQVLVLRAMPGIDPASLAPSVRSALWSLDGSLPLHSFRTVEELFSENIARRRFAMQLASGFALLALALCVLGVYGVVNYSVSEREQEIGVRLALGARAGQILAMTMKLGLGPAMTGVALGTAAAVSLTRFLQPVLFATEPRDTPTFTASIGLLLVAAIVAAWLPARLATRIDPARSLRGE